MIVLRGVGSSLDHFDYESTAGVERDFPMEFGNDSTRSTHTSNNMGLYLAGTGDHTASSSGWMTISEGVLHAALYSTWTGLFAHDMSSAVTATGAPDLAADEASAVLIEIYEFAAEKTEAETLRLIFTFIESSFLNKKLTVVDSLLSRVDLSKLSFEYIIAILRSTSRARAKLPHWNVFLVEAHFAFKHRGLNTKRLLRGLIDGNTATSTYTVTKTTHSISGQINSRGRGIWERTAATRRFSL